MKNSERIFIAVVLILVVAICVYTLIKQSNSESVGNNIVENNNSINNQTTDTVDLIDIEINTDDGDEKIDWSKYQSSEYKLTDGMIITSSGVYTLTGNVTNGLIKINTTGEVKLILNNVSIINSSGPAVLVEKAEDVVIELASGSKNYLEDGTTYTGYKEDEIGTIYSHSDITFQGDGILEVKSNNQDAIVGKDDLKIVSGTYIINSKDDGIRGKDSVYIQNGTFTINSDGDGIKSTNDTNTEKGFVLIEKGTFNINAELDGISAETKLLIKNGIFNITTGGGSGTDSTQSDWGNWGMRSSNLTNTTNTASAKGLKAGDNLVIENGTFTLNTSDDAIHSNNYIGIKNGEISIATGDDGIHADTEIIIDGGTINISKSYEGIEAAKITINDGNINLISSDDGINAAGGNDQSALGRRGANNFSSSTNNILIINGGTIYVNANGDGIDVNGSVYIYGGYIVVYGPTNSGNGALDYDSVFEVNGGTLLAGGAKGMDQGCSSSSKLYNLSISFNSNYGPGDVITLVDSVGNEIVSYESTKSYSSLIVASEQLENGKTYTINVNGTAYETFTISSITTNIGSMGNQMGGRFKQQGGFGGGFEQGIPQGGEFEFRRDMPNGGNIEGFEISGDMGFGGKRR